VRQEDVMTSESFEYAVKKDVRNNPIVREVDRERHKDMFRSLFTGAFLVIVLLFWAWQQFEFLRYGYRFEQMQQERAVEEEVNRHLRLEIETLSAPALIERKAIKQLGMVAPAPGEATILERVIHAQTLPKSVVARR
jgi:cell division protein FtsL